MKNIGQSKGENDMDKEHYWLWLTNIKGIGRKKIGGLIACFDSPEGVFVANLAELTVVASNIPYFSKKDLDALVQSRDMEKVIKYSNKLRDSGIQYLSLDHERYPKSLLNIFDPPYVIYYKGQLIEEEPIKIGIVGARRCSSYGKNVAEYFARKLAEQNVTIISGMARGIDTAAHKGAIKGGGQTTAVLGCGVNICYPPENISVMRDIINNGCLISEYPMDATPIAGNFPQRNRIISGLSDGLLIVEATERSGSLITADSALEQGKDVFAVPGKIFDPLSDGTNRLIKMGAKPVSDVEDILEEYIDTKKKGSMKSIVNEVMDLLDDNEKLVYQCISIDPVHLDYIIRQVPMGIDELNYYLIKLELKGFIEQLPNRYYVRKV